MGFNLGEVFKKDEETLVIDRRKQAMKAMIIFTVIIAIALVALIVLKNIGDVDENRRVAITKDIQNIQLYVKDKATQARTDPNFVYPGLDLNRSGDESAYKLNVNGYQEEFRYGYYYLSPNDYSDMSMALNVENEHYIVNYNTADVINVTGIKYGSGRYHSVDDLLAIASIKAGNNVPIPSATTILLKTPSDMMKLHENPNANFKMAANIDMASYEAGLGWKPVEGFTGNFDGRGYTISNLKVNRSTQGYVGLFGSVAGGTISNLTLLNVDIVGENYTGALAGTMAGHVSNVIVKGGTVDGEDKVGGLVGAHQGNISKCMVDLDSVSGREDVGGVVGELDSGVVERVSARTINVSGLSAVGGFVGCVSATKESYLQECVAVTQQKQKQNEETFNGGITGNTDIGGMIGLVEILSRSKLHMKNCYAVGNISAGKENKGGIVGRLTVSNQAQVNMDAIYAAVSILEKGETSGGCIGLYSSSTGGIVSPNDIFWEKDLAPGEVLEHVGKFDTNDRINFTSKTPSEMQTRATYTNWDFDVWEIATRSRPTLKFEKTFIEY
ncbi:MAG: hypothetical protein IJX99_06275 [Clostridia bacterium]|nr:hypothetical protein [Clostridia bacterium]